MERRALGRVEYPADSVVVICDDEEVVYVQTRDIGPLGVGVIAPPGTHNMLGKEVIVVCDTLIMFANVVRQDPLEDGCWTVGMAGKRFTQEVLDFIVDSLEMKTKKERG